MTRKTFKHQSEVRATAMAATFILLYGCATTPPPPPPLPIVAPDKTVNIDPYLLEACPPIQHVPVQKYTQGQTLVPTQKFLDQYSECAGKHNKLSKLAADAFNIATPASATSAASAPNPNAPSK